MNASLIPNPKTSLNPSPLLSTIITTGVDFPYSQVDTVSATKTTTSPALVVVRGFSVSPPSSADYSLVPLLLVMVVVIVVIAVTGAVVCYVVRVRCARRRPRGPKFSQIK